MKLIKGKLTIGKYYIAYSHFYASMDVTVFKVKDQYDDRHTIDVYFTIPRGESCFIGNGVYPYEDWIYVSNCDRSGSFYELDEDQIIKHVLMETV
jgi:hypothetical protein